MPDTTLAYRRGFTDGEEWVSRPLEDRRAITALARAACHPRGHEPEQDEAVRLADAVLEANRRWPNETRWASLHREAFVSGAEWAGAALATPPPEQDEAVRLAIHAFFVRWYGECVHRPDKGHGAYAQCEDPDECVPIRRATEVVAVLATPPPVPAAPCSGCGGRRWTEDENWSPDDPATWKGERSHGDGLIPCGFCNEGGWNTPDFAPTEPAAPAAPPALDDWKWYGDWPERSHGAGDGWMHVHPDGTRWVHPEKSCQLVSEQH